MSFQVHSNDPRAMNGWYIHGQDRQEKTMADPDSSKELHLAEKLTICKDLLHQHYSLVYRFVQAIITCIVWKTSGLDFILFPLTTTTTNSVVGE